MAKESFFIRSSVTAADPGAGGLGAYTSEPIDLGAFVDALGEAILDLHRISVSLHDGTIGGYPAPQGASGSCRINWQLTTQEQTGLVLPTDKSVIASGAWTIANDAAGVVQLIDETYDINPEDWTNSYMIAVEQIYLGTQVLNNLGTGDAIVSTVMECTSSKMTKAKAMALALSQQ